MRTPARLFLLPAILALAACTTTDPARTGAPKAADQPNPATAAAPDQRMAWWRDARFGMFIHWGLYAIPAGEWGTDTSHGEWIMNTAHIPVEEYEKFVGRFNPQKFDADAWVKAAKAAGMKYIVITSKHHDGFNLFDSSQTDYDVMSTPFKRDIMKEIAEACRRNDVKICWYHSIMDWHHPDYTPRREWEKRPADKADFDRYVAYLKGELKDLLTNYGPIGLLWFDGQWEGTWTHERGNDLYAYVRSLQPDIIINNRVDKGGGEFGMTKPGFMGDYGTPEQEIPPTGVPGVDWETCMTMNDHWGYNKSDHNFKSTETLIHNLVDIASKGGNFLLNVGPTADGEIPPESIRRLKEIGAWMDVYSESIYGTQASPIRSLAWGRCTQKALGGGKTRLYLHVFEWPKSGELRVDGIFNEDAGAYLLSDTARKSLAVSRRGDALVVEVPPAAPDKIDSVVVLDVRGTPDIANPPSIEGPMDVFVRSLSATLKSDRQNVQIRYTTDGSEPGPASALASGPITVEQTTTLAARAFRGERPVSATTKRTFTKVLPRPALPAIAKTPGLSYAYYEGDWDKVPDFAKLTPALTGVAADFDRKPRKQEEHFGFRYKGFISIPTEGAYRFFTNSDDGSDLSIGDTRVVDNDGLHSLKEASGVIALGAGLHPITVDFFEKSGGQDLEVWWEGPGIPKQKIPFTAFFTTP